MTEASLALRTGIITDHRKTLFGLLALALLLRAWPACTQGILHFDEMWQYLEPAHGIVFGRWIVHWEFRAGVRSWLLPDLLAAPMWLGSLFPHTRLYFYLPRLVVTASSLAVVAGAWLAGRTTSRAHAFFAAFACAVWIDLIDFGVSALSESISLDFFMLGAGLLAQGPRRRWMPVLAGALLAICFSIRLQNAPAILALVGWTAWRQGPTAARWIAAGLVIGLLPGAVAELAAGNAPYLWVLRNFDANLIQNKSASFGTAPFYSYLEQAQLLWLGLGVPILVLAVIGARRAPALACAGLVHLAVHSAIPHKEYRFVLLAVAVLILLAGLGTVELLVRWNLLQRRRYLLLACVGWSAASAAVAARGGLQIMGQRFDPILAANRLAGEQHGVCGMAVVGYGHPVGNYTTYHRDTEIFGFIGDASTERARQARAAFNVMIAEPGVAQSVDPSYVTRGCTKGISDYCVSQRHGPCANDVHATTLNQELARVGS